MGRREDLIAELNRRSSESPVLDRRSELMNELNRRKSENDVVAQRQRGRQTVNEFADSLSSGISKINPLVRTAISAIAPQVDSGLS